MYKVPDTTKQPQLGLLWSVWPFPGCLLNSTPHAWRHVWLITLWIKNCNRVQCNWKNIFHLSSSPLIPKKLHVCLSPWSWIIVHRQLFFWKMGVWGAGHISKPLPFPHQGRTYSRQWVPWLWFKVAPGFQNLNFLEILEVFLYFAPFPSHCCLGVDVLSSVTWAASC